MPVAELFIGAFITVLFEKLASGDLIKLARSAGIDSELHKWRNTLIQIQAVLVDAGQKHIQQTSVQIWLNNLQHLAYEIDDVLDDLATEAAIRRLKLHESSPTTSNNTRKVMLNFIPNKFHDFKYSLKMRSKLGDITTKLHHLIEQKNGLGLSVNVDVLHERRLEVTSMVNVPQVIGRENDKLALLGMLLDKESSSSRTQNASVVSIVGLGGIGKTTLAQHLYNDEEVKKHFELKAWVSVSDDFHEYNISKSIFQAVGGENKDFANLDLLQQALSQRLSNKKFLIVLDDVWNKDYSKWILLQGPFNKGSLGSKVLVTTRNNEVAKVMDSVQTYTLKLFSDKDALSLFAQHASGDQNFDMNRILKLYGEDIVKKCGSLPLALRTLGRAFRTKSTYEECEKLLNSEIWNLDDDEIPRALRLSYHDLPQHLKQIFTYCCLFPKDYMFDKDELVMLWMAEGFLYKPNRDELMEDLGDEYFKELVSRSFFQQLTESKSKYTMHDLIHDLATNVGGEFFLMLSDKKDVYNRPEALEKVYHLSFINEKNPTNKRSEAMQRARRLRTFLAMPVTYSYDRFNISNKVLPDITQQLQFLRVFSLANSNIEEVPQSIGSLKHLRYLNFSNTKITCLRDQVGNLHNLQSLLLCGCDYLSRLPNSITKLINLRHLDTSNTPSLDKMPLGLGELTSLQTLSRVIIGGVGGCRISDLKGLLHLRGQLSIEGLHKVKDAVQAKEANLHQKKGICYLKMKWSVVFDDSRNETTEHEVLEGLRPFEKLSRLEIKWYNGTMFPSWVGDPKFDCLTELVLDGCRSCTCLPTLGQLPALKMLTVNKMDGLKRVGSEFLRASSSCHGVAFPSLEVLRFSNMKEWEEWSTSGCGKAEAFPCVGEISITKCPKLKDVSIVISSINSLRQVDIEECQNLESYKCSKGIESLSIKQCPSITSLTSFQTMGNLPFNLKKLRIEDCDNMEVSWFVNNLLSSLEDLYISSIPNLRLFPKGFLVNLTKLTIENCDNIESIPDNCYGLCLRELWISNCKNLKSFPHEHLQSLTSLTTMCIFSCPSMDDSFPCGLWPTNLNSLRIGGLKKPISEWGMQNFPTSLVNMCLDGSENSRAVVSFAAKREEEEDIMSSSSSLLLPSSLTSLELWDFVELESVSEGLQHLTCLKQLYIYNCPKLRDLPETILPSLETLYVSLCYHPELQKRCNNRDGKYWPIISQITHHHVSYE